MGCDVDTLPVSTYDSGAMSTGSSPPTPDPLVHALRALAGGDRLTEAQVTAAFTVLMRGEAPAERAAAFLMGMRVQGERGPEVAGAARALRAVMRTVRLPAAMRAVDTAGTGGGIVTTFNVSTAAAFVAAGAGVPIAKHGNRSYTSKCGSADVFEALGVDLAAQADRAERLIPDVGMAFLFAPAFHPAMRFVAPVRRELSVPTVMNLVGPLANPARVERQVVGVADRERAPVIADALRRLEATHALVVHAEVGMDEISPSGRTLVWEVREGKVTEWEIEPGEFGAAWDDVRTLAGGEPKDNARRIELLLERPGKDPGGRAAVILNAGAAIYVGGASKSLGEGVRLAGDAIEAGKGAAVLDAMRRATPLRSAE
jgi:anthranilate phosphoribosyltransferase